MVKTDIKWLKTPLSVKDVENLKVKDMVLINGLIYTARDRVHKLLTQDDTRDLPFDLNGAVIYHCGPIVRDINGFQVLSAGPTTSMRLEMYEADFIKKYNIKGIIGKGGMGYKTLEALKKFGCVYFQAVGGASSFLATRIIKVNNVWKLEEFGMAEAMWVLEVKDFPVVVTMDSRGNSLYEWIKDISLNNLRKMSLEER
jgi:fumarate hydratase class I